MFPEPRRVEGARVPLELFIRPSTRNPQLFDVVDDEGSVVAREVSDLNTARVLAAAPRLLDGFYEMRWTLNSWFSYGYCGINKSEDLNEGQRRVAEWLKDMAEIEADARAPDGRFPL